MDVRKVASASFLLSLLGGCAAPVPVAENFPVSYQKVARTARHWDVIATDVVTQTANTLATTQRLQGRPILVVPTTRNTTFDAVFNDFLITQMVDRGIPVSVCPVGGTGMIQDPDLKVKYHARIVRHAEAPQYRPGLLTALATGVFVARAIDESDISRDARGLVGIAATGLIDAASGYMALATRTEVVVTTTIEEGNRFIMRRSDIYYIPDGDAGLFSTRVSHNPLCPSRSRDDSVALSAEEKADAERKSRYDLFVRNMRHTNPQWQPTDMPSLD